MTTTTHILGYPRIGEKRELKFAQEKYWRGEIDQAELKKVGAKLRHKNWQTQASAGLSFAVAGDFAWYDHVSDHHLVAWPCAKTPSSWLPRFGYLVPSRSWSVAIELCLSWCGRVRHDEMVQYQLSLHRARVQ